MNWYQVFYWLTVADGVKQFFDHLSNWFTFFTIVLGIGYLVVLILRSVYIEEESTTDEEEDRKNASIRAVLVILRPVRTFFWIAFAVCLFSWLAWALVPTKRDAIIIIAGGAVGNFITRDSSAKQVPSEIMEMLREKVKAEIREAKLDNPLNADTLGTKSKEELIKIIKEQATEK